MMFREDYVGSFEVVIDSIKCRVFTEHIISFLVDDSASVL